MSIVQFRIIVVPPMGNASAQLSKVTERKSDSHRTGIGQQGFDSPED